MDHQGGGEDSKDDQNQNCGKNVDNRRVEFCVDKGLDLGDLLDLYFVALVNDDLDGRDNGDVGVHALISGSSSSSTALLFAVLSANSDNAVKVDFWVVSFEAEHLHLELDLFFVAVMHDADGGVDWAARQEDIVVCGFEVWRVGVWLRHRA